MREKLADKKYQGVKMNVVFGDPGREIATFAKDEKADLIVLPSAQSATGLSHLLIGSVAEKVCRRHCPVLVLPGRESQAAAIKVLEKLLAER